MMLWIVWLFGRVAIDLNRISKLFLDILKPRPVEPSAHFECPIEYAKHGDGACPDPVLGRHYGFTFTDSPAIKRNVQRASRLVKRLQLAPHSPDLFGVLILDWTTLCVPQQDAFGRGKY